MRYTLLFHYPELNEQLTDRELRDGMSAFQAYAGALEDAGALVSAEMLQPSTATVTVRVLDGDPVIQDGPSAAAVDRLAGTFVIDVGDLSQAIDWAERAPSTAWGPIEVRPTATRWVDGHWVT